MGHLAGSGRVQSTDKPPCALPAPPCSRRHKRPSSPPAVSSPSRRRRRRRDAGLSPGANERPGAPRLPALQRAAGHQNVRGGRYHRPSEAAEEGAALTSVALPSQYWRRLSEHWPGVLRAFYPLAVSQAFANPEDAQRHGGLQYCRNDPDVERCLRAHRNDMETIYPFLFLGFVYSFLGPNPFIARMHFLVFFLGRMIHTVAYLGKLRAPTRSLAYTLAQLPCASMALQIVWEAARHL